MGTILTIVIIFAVIGAIIGLFSGEKGGMSRGALIGAAGSIGCMVRLMIIAIPVLIGIWLLGLVFG